MKVLGLSGSLRAGSHNSKLLRAAGELLPGEAELVEFDGL
jgi:chromate reductase